MTGKLQGGHRDGAVEEDGRSQKLLKVTPASMGPRRWSRGREYLSAILRPILDQLQWGHGDGAVEEFGRRRGALRVDHASMGPRRWSRGRDPHPHPHPHP